MSDTTVQMVREMSYGEMADLIQAMRDEVKDRNPLFVNAYTPFLDRAVAALEELNECEKDSVQDAAVDTEISE